MREFQIGGHEPSILPEGDWVLAWADEFDGTELDMSKWDYRLNMMGMRWPSWERDCVRLDGRSNAVFTLTNRDGKPVCSQLQTGCNFMDEPVKETTFGSDQLQWNIGKLHESRYLHGPGYYECRCRLQRKSGWWSAFWIQSPVIGASLDPADTGVEIDIMESFEPGKVLRHNVITGGYGQDMRWEKTLYEHDGLDTAQFHRFGLLWDETGYTFYIDGKEDGKIQKYITARPEFILISTEVRGFREKAHEPRPEAYDSVGDTFLVDYVRVFDRKA